MMAHGLLVGAILLLLALTGLVMGAIRRQLREQDQPPTDDAAEAAVNEERM